ncbi:glycosyltransferase family 2 protein [Geminocystis herdmanii]|uniref:glycosyltransferase family 2 protein n=1 Tax=Geminocystis herdmanii TaxID=669359 RepID=UPI0003477A55|nr:glycosyltransferase family 2 protein [Geminocystis herdmanii]
MNSNNNLYKVSIVCVTYKRCDLVLKCLQSCLEQDYPQLEIVVIVNPSNDGTEEAIQQKYPTVRLIKTHSNLGFFPALNLAIANTTGEYIMTVDDDSYFLTENAIAQMIQAFCSESELAVVTASIIGPKESPLNNTDRYIHVFKTGFTMIRKEVFFDWIGFYPDLFFRSAGETYLSTKLWDLNKRIKCLCNVTMYHEQSIQGRSDRDWKFYGLRSQVLCSIMREPYFYLVFSLISKGVKSLFLFIKWGHLTTWIEVWVSVMINISYAFKLRNPISWKTRKLLWKLEKEVIDDYNNL